MDDLYFNVRYLCRLYRGDLESRLNEVGKGGIEGVDEGGKILVLEDRCLSEENSYGMGILLGLSEVDELLIGEGLRMERRVIVEWGERGEVDQVGCLVGYG
ncbi:glutamate synthase central domain-containing protein, partial [Staphylococcus epidermidis]|uniref:glutamate synthase central domain-containing protein n=1 Tax=Staphylococcus epidermidis TaxID=1282 RepID=UPI0016428857